MALHFAQIDIYIYIYVYLCTQSLLSRGYPYKLISRQINHASHIVRTKSLTRNSNKNTNEKRITFITEFHPSIATFLKNINKDWLNIRTDNRFNNKLSNPIILANKQPRNLQQLLTRSKNTFCVRGAPWSAANRLHGQRTGAFSWRSVLGLSRKTDQFRLDPTQNGAPGWWCDRV